MNHQIFENVSKKNIQNLFNNPILSAPGPKVKLKLESEIKDLVMFASNDYLNLSTDPRITAEIKNCLDTFGVGAGSSRVCTGYSYWHQQLEEQLAASYGREAAILFPTGFDAISAPATYLLSNNDRAIIDASSHASVIDGVNNSGAVLRFFAHNNLERLEATLKRARNNDKKLKILVIIEGAYSMDGDIAPADKIVKLCKRYSAQLLIDEAHSLGLYGNRGLGVGEHFNCLSEIDIIGGTFSKSLGSCGGFLVADKDIIEFLNYKANKIIFSAALPPMLIAGVTKAFEIIQTDTYLKEQLWENVSYLAHGLNEVGAKLIGTETASLPVMIGDDKQIFDMTKFLINNEIFTYPVVYPAVPKNKSIFRLAIQAKHSKEDLNKCIDAFDKLIRQFNLCS